MESFATFVPYIIAATLFSAFVMASRMRLATFMALFRIQSLLLVALLIVEATQHVSIELLIMAACMFVLKVLLIPALMLRGVRAGRLSERLFAYVRPTLLAFGALVLVLISLGAAYLAPIEGTNQLIVAASLALLLIGALLLVTRTDMFGQAGGFLTMENGIFAFGLAIGGMPLLLEIGALFDVLIGFILIMALTMRAQKEHATTATEPLQHLTEKI